MIPAWLLSEITKKEEENDEREQIQLELPLTYPEDKDDDLKTPIFIEV